MFSEASIAVISKPATTFQEKKVTDQYRVLKFSIRKLNLGWSKIDKILWPSGFYLTTTTKQLI